MTTRIHCATCDVVYVLPERVVLDRPTLSGDDAVAFMRYHAHTHTVSPTLTLEETDHKRPDVETRDVGAAELHTARCYMLGHDDGVMAAAAAIVTFARGLDDQTRKNGAGSGTSSFDLGVSYVVRRVVNEARALARRKRW